jgi:hypothetical protein
MNEKRSRYRAEDGVLIIDVRLASVERLFDNRDPAPFRERDLDPSLVEYLIDSCHDMATRPFRIVFWLEQTSPPAGVEAAVRAHFAYDLVRLDRDRGIQRRIGWIALSIASVAIVALIGVSNLIAELVTGTLGAGLKEALLISGWVLMWRPVELLIYDSIPWRHERNAVRRILNTPIQVRLGNGPPAETPPLAGDGACR